MPKHSPEATLKRWMALDFALREPGYGVRVKQFAKEHKVNEKTVYRDLRLFRSIGLSPISVRTLGKRKDFYVWVYHLETEGQFLFATNRRQWLRHKSKRKTAGASRR